MEIFFTARKRLKHASLHSLCTVSLRVTSCLLWTRKGKKDHDIHLEITSEFTTIKANLTRTKGESNSY